MSDRDERASQYFTTTTLLALRRTVEALETAPGELSTYSQAGHIAAAHEEALALLDRIAELLPDLRAVFDDD